MPRHPAQPPLKSGCPPDNLKVISRMSTTLNMLFMLRVVLSAFMPSAGNGCWIDNGPGTPQRPCIGQHRKPSSGCDMFWQDGTRSDIRCLGRFGEGLDEGVRCGDKKF
jgi:hypothetical protein